MKSYGEKLLKEALDLLIIENVFWDKFNIKTPNLLINKRPKWLYGLELDFYIPELNLAFEFQGEQHYRGINDTEFLKRYFYDIQKDIFCKRNNIILVRLNATSITFKPLVRAIHYTLFDYYGFKKIKHKKSEICILPNKKCSNKHKLLLKSFYYFEEPSQIRKKKVYNHHIKINKYRELLQKKGCTKMTTEVFSNTFYFRNIAKKITANIKNGKKPVLHINNFLKGNITIDDICNNAIIMSY